MNTFKIHDCQNPAEPLGLGLGEGLGAGAEARCCAQCDDGDGNCAYPFYGLAPHSHDPEGEYVGSTQFSPRSTWPPNFQEDPPGSGAGVYVACMHCGRPAR